MDHDSWRWIFLFWFITEKECVVDDLREHDGISSRLLPSKYLSSQRITFPSKRLQTQWFFWGYSLAFSDDASPYIGTLSSLPQSTILLAALTPNFPFVEYFGLKGITGQVSVGSPRIPGLMFVIYQCMFAAIT